MEAGPIVQKLIQIQAPDLDSELLNSLASPLEAFFKDLNQILIFIYVDEKVILLIYIIPS